MTIEAIQNECMCTEIGLGVDKLRLRWVYFWQKYHNSIKDTKTLLRGLTLVGSIFKNIFQSCILESCEQFQSCEHFPVLWAFSSVVSIFQSCVHFGELWAFWRVVSILESCEQFSELWTFSSVVSIFQSCEHFSELCAFWRVVSILESCEHFPVLWASSDLWELPGLACICKSCNVVKIYYVFRVTVVSVFGSSVL